MSFLGKRKYFKAILGSWLALSLIGFSIFCLKQYQTTKRERQPQTVLQQIVSKLQQHYPLPSGEQPTLARVQDADTISQQPFFKDAHNGDDVLIYQKSKLAIIYRPSTNKIINAGPAVVNTASASTPPSSTPSHFAGLPQGASSQP